MNYKATLKWMFSELPMYQRQGKTAFKKDLTNIKAFCKVLKNPETKFNSIHVAGTNGKGSTSHMLASILQQQGYKVGLYTSPHLKDFRERIRVNGVCISEQNVVEFIEVNSNFLAFQKPSFFEMTVSMAFDYFAKQNVDVAIVEVGLGGRLDSTNILKPLISVITNIGLDHTQFLGETLPEIAFEKAGIIKQNTPVIIGKKQIETTPVFSAAAKNKKVKIYFAEDFNIKNHKTDLLGDYQQNNVKTALSTLSILKEVSNFTVSDKNIANGLLHVVKNTGLKGRYQILGNNPKIICDTAHNIEGLSLVIPQILKEKFKKLHIIFGVVDDKNLDKILPLFPEKASYYFCKPNIPRGKNANVLKEHAKRFGLMGNVYKSVLNAFNSAKQNAKKNDLIFVGGSTFVVAELPL